MTLSTLSNKYHKSVLFIALILFISFSALAKKNITSQDVADRIVQLTENDEILPIDMLDEINQIIDLSEKNNWKNNLVSSNTLKAEVFSNLEQLSSAQKIVEIYLPIAIEQKLKKLEIRLRMVELTIYDAKGYSSDVENKINHLLIIADTWPNKSEAGSIYLSLGHSYFVHGKLNKALVVLKKAYTIFNEFEDYANLSNLLVTLGNLYSDLGDTDTATKYLIEALTLSRKLKDRLNSSIIAYSLGRNYIESEQLMLADKFLTESLDLSQQIGDEIGEVWAKQAIADLNLLQNKPELALSIYTATEKTFQAIGNQRERYHAIQGKFDSYIQLEQFNLAEKELNQMSKLLPQLNHKAHNLSFTKREAEFAFIKGLHRTAYEKLKIFTEQQKLNFDDERQTKIAQLRVNFETEIAEEQNKALQKENELQQLLIEQQDSERIFWIIILLMALVTIITIVISLIKLSHRKQQYKSMALKDSLTKAPNRRAVLHNAELLLSQAQNEQVMFAIAIVDLDKFKRINDNYGHDVGDEVLKAFATACNITLRKEDNYGRFGGEEWLFAFKNLTSKDINIIFDRIFNALNNLKIKGYPDNMKVNFSSGVAFNDNNSSIKDLIHAADIFLYKAKETGRNKSVFSNGEHKFNQPQECSAHI